MADPAMHYKSLRGHSAIRLSYHNKLGADDIVVNYGADPDIHQSWFRKIFVMTGIVDDPAGVVKDSYSKFYNRYKMQSRGVTTFVLGLNDEQIESIVDFINSELKTGRGTRPFDLVTYNCASMVVEALNKGLPKPIKMFGMDMPDKLANELRKNGFVTQIVHQSR